MDTQPPISIGCLNIYDGFRIGAGGKQVTGPGYAFFELLREELNRMGHNVRFYDAPRNRRVHFDILVCGCYPKRPETLRQYRAKVKLFWSAENLSRVGLGMERVMNQVDYFVGYTGKASNQIEKRPNGKTLLRFPCWMFCCPGFMGNNEELAALIAAHKNPSERQNTVSLIARNANGGSRMRMVQQLRQAGHPVSCPSKVGKNTGKSIEQVMGISDWRRAKIEYLRKFRFNLCPENTSTPGYTTEKLFHACLAGAIPIYWGDQATVISDGIVNPDCVVWCPNRQTVPTDRLSERATQEIEFFLPQAVEKIGEVRDNFRAVLKEILGKIRE